MCRATISRRRTSCSAEGLPRADADHEGLCRGADGVAGRKSNRRRPPRDAQGRRKQRDVRTYGEETRGAVLKAAEKLFATRGLHDTFRCRTSRSRRTYRARRCSTSSDQSSWCWMRSRRDRCVNYRATSCRPRLRMHEVPAPDLLAHLFRPDGQGDRSQPRALSRSVHRNPEGFDGAGWRRRVSRPPKWHTFDMLVEIFRRGQERREIISRPASPPRSGDGLRQPAVGSCDPVAARPTQGSAPAMLSALVRRFPRGRGLRLSLHNDVSFGQAPCVSDELDLSINQPAVPTEAGEGKKLAP